MRQISSKLGSHFVWLDFNAFLISKNLWNSDVIPLLEYAIQSSRGSATEGHTLSHGININGARVVYKPLHEENLRQRPVGDDPNHHGEPNTASETIIELNEKLEDDDINRKLRDEESGLIGEEIEHPIGENNPFFAPDGTLDGYVMHSHQSCIYPTVTDSVANGLLDEISTTNEQPKNINDYYLVVRQDSFAYDRIKRKYDTSRCGVVAFPDRFSSEMSSVFGKVLTGTICAYIKSLLDIAFKNEKPTDYEITVQEIETPCEAQEEYVVMDGLFSWVLIEEREKKVVNIN